MRVGSSHGGSGRSSGEPYGSPRRRRLVFLCLVFVFVFLSNTTACMHLSLKQTRGAELQEIRALRHPRGRGTFLVWDCVRGERAEREREREEKFSGQ